MKRLFFLFTLSLTGLFGRLPEEQWKAVCAQDLRVGDLVFTRTGGPLFARVASSSGTWCSHVGILVECRNGEWIVEESKVPVVCRTPLRRFLDRSQEGLFEIRRLPRALTPEESQRLQAYASSQLGRPYDTGFDIASRRTFCSKFARCALHAATGQWVGHEETFSELLLQRQTMPLWFWRVWYFGMIPWERRTITPAMLLTTPDLVTLLRSAPRSQS